MHWPGRQEKAHELLNFNFLFGQHGKLQVTMQSSSAEVTMMESQNRKRAPAWTKQEVWDLIAVWGEESVLSELCSSFRNAKTFVKISQGMKDRGNDRDPTQCRVKLKELRQAYQKTREVNGRSGSEPKTCHFYDELHAFLGGSATTTPAVLFDSFNGHGGKMEAGFGDKEDDDDEVVDSSQQASGETGFPDSQELFLTWTWSQYPPNPAKAASRTLQAEKGPLDTGSPKVLNTSGLSGSYQGEDAVEKGRVSGFWETEPDHDTRLKYRRPELDKTQQGEMGDPDPVYVLVKTEPFSYAGGLASPTSKPINELRGFA
ncbi:hypothetical protein UY3_01762 [Chelonia mydas]|uniref:Myb/SANT-like DNA-binding domain-containing protein n=1 Tax=Chelonia mydas TaxID=8469 RepID=M7BYL4_CHEMY|nr:hypothetical protein UY3_01762 [Chelonia mydas]